MYRHGSDRGPDVGRRDCVKSRHDPRPISNTPAIMLGWSLILKDLHAVDGGLGRDAGVESAGRASAVSSVAVIVFSASGVRRDVADTIVSPIGAVSPIHGARRGVRWARLELIEDARVEDEDVAALSTTQVVELVDVVDVVRTNLLQTLRRRRQVRRLVGWSEHWGERRSWVSQ